MTSAPAAAESPAGGLLLRPMLLGEPWSISAPWELAGFLDACFGHLPAAPDGAGAMSLAIRQAPAPEADDWPGTVQQRSGSVVRQVYPGTEIVYDSAQRSAQLTVRGADALQTAVGTESIARMLILRAADLGLVPIHTAAIGRGGSFWLIPAAGGTGKSTATALAVDAGLDSLGDDFVMWDPRTGTVHSISRTLRLTPESARTLDPQLLRGGFSQLWRRPDGKAVFAIPRERMAASGTVAGLLLIGADRPAADPAAAYRALSSSLLLHSVAGIHPGASAQGLARLARTAPSRSLARDPDLPRWADTLVQVCGG